MSAALHHDLLYRLLVGILYYGTSFQFKDVVSLGEFTLSELKHFIRILGDSVGSNRGKVVKWLVDEVTRKGTVTNEDAGILLRGLIFNNKRSAAQWLFNRFRFSLDAVLALFDNPPHRAYVFLATWKMVLGMFPGITGDVIRQEHCVEMALKTPLHAQFTMSKLGLTVDDVEALCNNGKSSLRETADWLHQLSKPPHLPTIFLTKDLF
ncbi:hypothetical protein Pelo_19251 [Pelomyxa schiedti]|nr:hypothetical protein Pelo_19251 [Pelomyxa schiedti]